LFVISGVMLAGTSAFSQAVNFADSNQGYQHYGGYNVLYYGQGAYSDPGNNIWNGFGNYGGPGSTDFFGGGNPDSAHGSVPSNSPGNPYAWHSGTSSSGTSLFSPANFGAGNVGNATSAGTISPITLSLNYGFDNGVGNVGLQSSVVQGAPSYLLAETAGVNGGATGTAILQNIPYSTVSLYLYGANFDNSRGAAFAVTIGGGTAVGGFTETLNADNGGPGTSFVLGANYVEFTGVTPVGGTVEFTWSGVSNPNSGLSGEGDFNGLQIVNTPGPVPEPTTLAMLGLGASGLLALRRRKA
jgi:hypothetical protein